MDWLHQYGLWVIVSAISLVLVYRVRARATKGGTNLVASQTERDDAYAKVQGQEEAVDELAEALKKANGGIGVHYTLETGRGKTRLGEEMAKQFEASLQQKPFLPDQEADADGYRGYGQNDGFSRLARSTSEVKPRIILLDETAMADRLDRKTADKTSGETTHLQERL
jgi:hypothetical protein